MLLRWPFKSQQTWWYDRHIWHLYCSSQGTECCIVRPCCSYGGSDGEAEVVGGKCVGAGVTNQVVPTTANSTPVHPPLYARAWDSSHLYKQCEPLPTTGLHHHWWGWGCHIRFFWGGVRQRESVILLSCIVRCACVCVCVCACVCVCMRVCVHACVRACAEERVLDILHTVTQRV